MIRTACRFAALTLVFSHAGQVRAADPAPAYTTLAAAGDDYFFQGEFSGNHVRYGAAGLQIVAEGAGRFRGILLPGGLPGAGWDHSRRIEFAGEREGSVLRMQGPEGSIVVQVGAAVVRDAFGRQLGWLRRTLRSSPTLGLAPPAGAILLFDGGDTGELDGAKISPAGHLMHGVTTKRAFADFHLHLEFRTPFMPTARGQARGNSGVYVQQRYEVQILDSFGLTGENNECGGLYKTKAPDVNMCLPPLAWQTYDIDFTAARYDAAGRKVGPARVTVRHNGVIVQNDVALPNKTGGGKPEGPDPLPIVLQNHNNPVEFRNIWIVPR